MASAVRLFVVFLFVGIFAVGVSDRARSQAPNFTPRDETPEEFPNAPGREDTFYACTACHGFKLVASQSMSREQWDETLDFMVQRHNMPKLDDKDRQAVLGYLTRAFPSKAPVKNYQNPFLKN